MMIYPAPDGVIFDCDSTLSSIEGIDELAALKDCREQITALTDQAMNGEVPLEAVYSKRLDIIAPNVSDIDQIATHYLNTITPGAGELITCLQQAGIRIGIVSGGLRSAILPLAKHLQIAEEDVFAVDLAFDEQGHYQAVQPSPLTTASGKREIVRQWKNQHHLQRVYLIGDGVSDVAALAPEAAERVIGYGGVVAREAVRQTASCFYESQDLRSIANLWGMQP